MGFWLGQLGDGRVVINILISRPVHFLLFHCKGQSFLREVFLTQRGGGTQSKRHLVEGIGTDSFPPIASGGSSCLLLVSLTLRVFHCYKVEAGEELLELGWCWTTFLIFVFLLNVGWSMRTVWNIHQTVLTTVFFLPQNKLFFFMIEVTLLISLITVHFCFLSNKFTELSS